MRKAYCKNIPKTFLNNGKINEVSTLVSKFKNNANNSINLAYKAETKAQLFKSTGKALGGIATVYGFTQTSKDFKEKLDSGNVTSLDKAIYVKDTAVALTSVIPVAGSVVGFVDMGVDTTAFIIDKTLDTGREESLQQSQYFQILRENAQVRALKTIKVKSIEEGRLLSLNEINAIYKSSYSIVLDQLNGEVT
ncbi:MAG: hypothetical protein U5K55_08740 [Aliarcobacter sp.]|nr:hypothetical protein [Aliarcobacter sp.]